MTDSMAEDPSKVDPMKAFTILISTDNHLGFMENHPDRGQDSFTTYEEVLEMGKKEKVDFILLGGDLFHENKPSKRAMVDCMNALARNCRGDAPVYMKLISDPSENFKGAVNPIPNWEDPNINICLPVFSIHGNHDDPSGVGGYCALDELSTAGLVNYFGRTGDFNRGITLTPVLLKKPGTTIAIYGLSAMKDDRVYRLFYEKKVTIVRHSEPTFNILVVHQNREKHADGRYLPESFLDFRDGDKPFFNLVLWGHEHECKQAVELAVGGNYFLLQPGSSVATSLCPGEAVEKRVFLMTVRGEKFFVKHRKLQTVRPMIHKTVNLKDLEDEINFKAEDPSKEVEDYLETVVREAVDEAKESLTGHPKQPTRPLIRINVEYEDERHLFNTIRFGQRFGNILANPESLILLKKTVKKSRLTKEEIDGETMPQLDRLVDFHDRGPDSIEAIVEEFFSTAEEGDMLAHLAPELLSAAVISYVMKQDDNSVQHCIDREMLKAIEFIGNAQVSDDVGEERVDELVAEFRALRKVEIDEEVERFKKDGVPIFGTDAQRNGNGVEDGAGGDASIDDFGEGSDEDVAAAPATRGRGRGRGRARGATPRARGRGRGATSSSSSSFIDDVGLSSDSEDFFE